MKRNYLVDLLCYGRCDLVGVFKGFTLSNFTISRRDNYDKKMQITALLLRNTIKLTNIIDYHFNLLSQKVSLAATRLKVYPERSLKIKICYVKIFS